MTELAGCAHCLDGAPWGDTGVAFEVFYHESEPRLICADGEYDYTTYINYCPQCGIKLK